MQFDKNKCRCECPECFRDREGTRITLHKKKFNGIGECPYCQEYILNSDIKKCAYCQEITNNKPFEIKTSSCPSCENISDNKCEC